MFASIIRKLFLGVSFLFITYLYFHNLSTSVYGGDVGDLIAAAVVFGVPHAPGYPLFVLIGHLYSLLPFAATPAYKVGIVSVVSSLVSVIIYYRFCIRFTKSFFISVVSTAIFAFSYLFWLYTEIAEVFALNNVIVLAMLTAAFLYAETKLQRYYFLSLFFCGLTLTNHHTGVLVFPSVVLILYGKQIKDIYTQIKKRKLVIHSNWKFIGVSLVVFLAGLLPYIYIPFAARTNPPVNWDDAKDIPQLIHLFLRKDYGTFNAGITTPSSFLAKLISLKDYIIVSISSITFPGWIIGVIGVWTLLQRKKKEYGIALLLAWVLTGPAFIWYAGFPLYNYFTIGVVERFYILSSVIFMLFLPFGFLTIQQFFQRFFTQKLFASIVMCAFICIPILLFTYNSQKTNLATVTIGDQVARDILSPLPPHAVLFMSGDTLTFNTWYVSYALHMRSDVHLVHILGAGSKVFMEKEKKEYLTKHTEKNAEKHMFPNIYYQLLAKYPVFTLSQFTTQLHDYLWMPLGLTYQLITIHALPQENVYKQQVTHIWDSLHIPYRTTRNLSLGNLTISEIPSAYSDSLIATGKFFQEQYKDEKEAEAWFTRAIAIDPTNASPYSALGLLYFSFSHDCVRAQQNFEKAVSLDRLNDSYYIIMFLVYRSCHADEQKITRLKQQYQSVFHQSLDEAVKKKSDELTKEKK